LEEVIALVNWDMIKRAIFMVAVAISLSVGIASANETSNLVGSTVKTEDAASRSQTIFIGRLVSLGQQNESMDPLTLGPLYRHAKIRVLASIKGAFDSVKSVRLCPNAVSQEKTPIEGASYIFFIEYDSGASTTYILKLLDATDENIARVKKLISK
jgi:hypothetical protein